MPTYKKRKLVQAFTAPKDKNTKAILKRNATSSPLLSLPLELREKIWGLVLGNQLIHIAGAEQVEWLPALRRYKRVPRLYHAICQSSCTEREAYELSKTLKNVQTQNSMKAEEAKLFLPGDRHADCLAELAAHESKGDPPPHGLNVNVLTVCRQVYVDANPILWGSNTWSFNRHASWRFWLEKRNAVQRRLLRKVHLWEWVIFQHMPKALLSSLKVLDELHVAFNTIYSGEFDTVNAAIPAEKIAVIAYDFSLAEHLHPSVEFTSFETRVALAEQLRSRLFELQTKTAQKRQEKANAKLLTGRKSETGGMGNDEDEAGESLVGENKK